MNTAVKTSIGQPTVEISDKWSTFSTTGHPEEIRNELIVHYMPWVNAVANRLSSKLPEHAPSAEDLAQAGVFGLMDAIEAYDPDVGTKFETFALLRVNGAMLDSLRDFDWVPRLVRRHQSLIKAAEQRLLTKSSKPIDATLIAEEMGMSDEQYQQFRTQNQVVNTGSLSHGEVETDSGKLLPSVDQTDNKAIPPEYLLTNGQDLLPVLLRGMSIRERVVVILYLYEECNMKEIGGQIGLSESRVSQMFTQHIIPKLLQNALTIPDWDSERCRRWVSDFIQSQSRSESDTSTLNDLGKARETFSLSLDETGAIQFRVVEEETEQCDPSSPVVQGAATQVDQLDLNLRAEAFGFSWKESDSNSVNE